MLPCSVTNHFGVASSGCVSLLIGYHVVSASLCSMSVGTWRQAAFPSLKGKGSALMSTAASMRASGQQPAVVSHDVAHGDAAVGEPGHDAGQEGDGRFLAFVAEDLDIGETSAVVHSDMNKLPACADLGSPSGRVPAGDSMARATKPAQLLDVQVD